VKLVDQKRWRIDKNKDDMRMVVCPYCDHRDVFPYPECPHCREIILSPEESEIKKVVWW
jgi:RNase P subunit RPR2